MNKSELIDAIAAGSDLSKADAKRALDATTAAITSALSSGDSVALTGFGSFLVRDRAARDGRNPKTGETINTVKASYHVTQNEEIVEQVVKGMENYGELSVSKAYSINGGRRVALQLGIEGQSTVNGDEIKKYVTIVDSNDGTSGLGVGIGNLTMSCQNQFYKFYKDL